MPKYNVLRISSKHLIMPTIVVTTTAILTAGAVKVVAGLVHPHIQKLNDKLDED